MFDFREKIKDFLYTPTYIVCPKETFYAEEILVTKEIHIVNSYLDTCDTEENELPVVIHGVVIPVTMLHKEILDCDNLYLLSLTENDIQNTDINDIIEEEGMVFEAMINELTQENRTTSLDEITDIIEEEMTKYGIEIADIYIILGYKTKMTVSVDFDSIDEDKLRLPEEIADEVVNLEGSLGS